jgi:hypothetical protein
MKFISKLLYANALLVLVLLVSCQKEIQQPSIETGVSQSRPSDIPGFVENNMVLRWNEIANSVLSVGFTQPPRTRVFARIQVAVHDALNSIKPKYERYASNEREQHADPDAAVASAAYWILKRTVLVGNPPIDQWYNESLATIPDGKKKELGIDLGKRCADALIANRANDGFTQLIVNSVNPPNGIYPGEYRSTLMASNWVPTQIQFGFRNVPNWGTVMKPWVIQTNQQFRPAAPYSVNSAHYTEDYIEVKSKGARVGGNRTVEEEQIALFWSENNPSKLWNDIARTAIADKKMDAWKTARLFALLHVCLAESISSALDANYHYYYWRPESAIRLGNSDGNDETEGDPDWLPYLSEAPVFITPPVPGYPNGASAYGGAGAEILKLVLGTDKTSINIQSTNSNPAVSSPKPIRHFSSFSQASTENMIRNVYCGWDFRTSSLVGEDMGKQIAAYVFTHAFREE